MWVQYDEQVWLLPPLALIEPWPMSANLAFHIWWRHLSFLAMRPTFQSYSHPLDLGCLSWSCPVCDSEGVTPDRGQTTSWLLSILFSGLPNSHHLHRGRSIIMILSIMTVYIYLPKIVLSATFHNLVCGLSSDCFPLLMSNGWAEYSCHFANNGR